MQLPSGGKSGEESVAKGEADEGVQEKNQVIPEKGSKGNRNEGGDLEGKEVCSNEKEGGGFKVGRGFSQKKDPRNFLREGLKKNGKVESSIGCRRGTPKHLLPPTAPSAKEEEEKEEGTYDPWPPGEQGESA